MTHEITQNSRLFAPLTPRVVLKSVRGEKQPRAAQTSATMLPVPVWRRCNWQRRSCSGSDAANDSANDAVVALTVHQEADFEDAAESLMRLHKVFDDDGAVLDGGDVGVSELPLLEDVRECTLDHGVEDIVGGVARHAAAQSVGQNLALGVIREAGLGELRSEILDENLNFFLVSDK